MQLLLAIASSCALLQRCRGALVLPPRPPSTITHSLINMGKIDVALYLNSPDAVPRKDAQVHQRPILRKLPQMSHEETQRSQEDYQSHEKPCPCSGMRDLLRAPSTTRPSDVLSKLFVGGDLFSVDREQSDHIHSGLCCDSPDSKEDMIILEMSGPHPILDFNRPPYSPLTLTGGLNDMIPLSSWQKLKREPKIKKKDMSAALSNANIKVVGDKKITVFNNEDFLVATTARNAEAKLDKKEILLNKMEVLKDPAIVEQVNNTENTNNL